MKEFFWPFREKKKNYYQFAHEVDLDYNDMFKFATEILTTQLACMKHQKNQALIWAIQPSTHKTEKLYVTYLTNVNIDNPVDAIGILKVNYKPTFYNLKRKERTEMILQQGVNLSKLDKGCIILIKKRKDIKSYSR
jgi:hypothetical protein